MGHRQLINDHLVNELSHSLLLLSDYFSLPILFDLCDAVHLELHHVGLHLILNCSSSSYT